MRFIKPLLLHQNLVDASICLSSTTPFPSTTTHPSANYTIIGNEPLYEIHAAGMMPPVRSFTVRDDKEKHVCWVMSERNDAVACLFYVTNNSMWRLTSLGVHEANVIVFRQLVLSVPNRLHSALHILLHTGSRICTLHVNGSASATMGRAALAFATATVVAVRWCPFVHGRQRVCGG